MKSFATFRVALLTLIAVLAISPALFGKDDEFSQEQLDFFENRIRPLLVNHCLQCHSAEKNESGLRLDSRAGILKGGASGDPGAVLKNPDESLIVQAVRYSGDYDMPPNEKLSDEEISALASWVEIGMPWPNSTSISKLSMPELILEHQRKHWSFQPIKSPEIPAIETDSKFPLDALIRAKLKTPNLTPSKRADRRTLIRRAYFDLTGLPPTHQEVQSFVNDKDPAAYPKLIDRLLASPHYGERWARHWLDVARYSDTSGYKLEDADRNYPFAFTFRDYVIDALNNDLPYDQFIKEQLAADHLDRAPDNRSLAALGFITVGRQFLGREETVDDQVDVVTRGLMGLTVSCARCHDHKYDAIPTADYYSLYSVFNNNYVPPELPLIGDPEELKKFAGYFEKLEAVKQEVESYRELRYADLRKHIEEYPVEYLSRAVVPGKAKLIQEQPFIKLTEIQIRPALLKKWQFYLAKRSGNQKKVMTPAVELLKLPEEGFAENAKKLVQHWADEKDPKQKLNPIVLGAFKENPPKTKIEIGKIYGEVFKSLIDQWKSKGSRNPPIEQFKGPRRQLALTVFGAGSPLLLKPADFDRQKTIPEKKKIEKLRSAVTKLNSNSPDGLARAMVLRDKDNLTQERVMSRGNIRNRGEIAPRRFVALLSEPERPLFERKSGRLDLAEKIASPTNPLTARVLVNRVWMHHFSTPIVDTPSDFGIRCEEPLQRDVLDYLARDFIDSGWSIKSLHRKIMLSETYCQSSQSREAGEKVDPENRLYWKMNRRRLEFEPLRDSILAVSGNLDKTIHGKAVDIVKGPLSKRRTIYGKIDRQDLPNKLVRNAPNFKNADKKTRITSLYRTVLQRDPTQEEFKIGVQFITEETAARLARLAKEAASEQRKNESEKEKNERIKKENPKLIPWQRYAQALLCTNEFEFID